MVVRKKLMALLAAASVLGCSPSLDWREFMAEGSGVFATFPCRPDHHARGVRLNGATLQMEMLVCSAGEATYAIAYVDVADPARVAPLLGELRAVALANVQGVQPTLAPVQIAGMTPNPQALRMSVTGRLPDGSAVQSHSAYFAHGLRLYQATVIGPKPSAEAVQTFFGGLKFPA